VAKMCGYLIVVKMVAKIKNLIANVIWMVKG